MHPGSLLGVDITGIEVADPRSGEEQGLDVWLILSRKGHSTMDNSLRYGHVQPRMEEPPVRRTTHARRMRRDGRHWTMSKMED